MTNAKEHAYKAEEAKKHNAHVAVLTNYRSAIEAHNYNARATPILLQAIKYAQNLKKQEDRDAIVEWSTEILDWLPTTYLDEIIAQEIETLSSINKKQEPNK